MEGGFGSVNGSLILYRGVEEDKELFPTDEADTSLSAGDGVIMMLMTRKVVEQLQTSPCAD